VARNPDFESQPALGRSKKGVGLLLTPFFIQTKRTHEKAPTNARKAAARNGNRDIIFPQKNAPLCACLLSKRAARAGKRDGKRRE